MFQNNIFDDKGNRTANKIPGLIGAMMDGWVTEFDFNGLKVQRSGNSIQVLGPYDRPAGGMLLIDSTTVIGVQEWLENKAELYGEQ